VNAPRVVDPPNESCGIKEQTRTFISLLKTQKSLANGYRGGSLLPTTFLRMSERKISSLTTIIFDLAETDPDAERLLQGLYLPALETEHFILSGLILGAFRAIFLNVLLRLEVSKSKKEERFDGFRCWSQWRWGSSNIHEEAQLVVVRELPWACAYVAHIDRKKFGIMFEVVP
jgi:hypothetical protein